MKKSALAFVLAITMIGLVSCRKVIGTGPVVTETRNETEFSKIDFAVSGDLHFVPSDKYEIIITAQQNVIDVIETHVKGDELKIELKNNVRLKSNEELSVTVKAPFVNSVGLSGSGNLRIPEPFSASLARFALNGSGNFSVEHVEAETMEVRVVGSGNMKIFGGSVSAENVSISGSGNMDISAVDAVSADARISGSGDVRLSVRDVLNVAISGSGDVYYKGSPAVSANISGSGRVSKM